MKKCYPIFFIVFLFFNCTVIFAQQKAKPVKFIKGDFFTGDNILNQNFNKSNLVSSLFNDHYFVLVQFDQLPSSQRKEELKNAGIELGDYLPGNAYLASIKTDFNFLDLKVAGISSVNPLPAFYKIHPSLDQFQLSNEKDNLQLMAVQFYPAIDKKTAEKELQKLGAVIATVKYSSANRVFVKPDKAIVNAIAALPFVGFINLQNVTDKPLNYKSIALHAVSGLQSILGKNLNGKNIAVGVGDNADVGNLIDFTGRVINRVFSVPSFHGSHTSGTVAGGGLLDVRNKGMAPRATLISQWFSDIITNTPTYVTDYNMIATNNSYYAGEPGCVGNRLYDVISNYTDLQMKNYETVLHVFSAGNDGALTCAPYPTAFGTIKSGFQVAKNVLTVGAINQANYTIASFSSRGPVHDGRIKPEIVANGVNIFSNNHVNGYNNNSGTSMSGPVVAGAVTLLNESYRNQNAGAIPKAALIKAILCNTAEDLGNPGPDYTFGFGNLNAKRAVEAIEGNRFYINNTSASYSIVVPAGARSLKVMLYWADPAASPNAATALVNDYDLTVTDAFTNTWLPLTLNPNNVSANAIEAVDRINNIEQVVINNPATGNFSMNVAAFAIPQGPQEYILTYQIEMNGITVEYPFGGETLVPGEIEFIRWSAYGDNANTFTVEYSDNNGSSWSTLNNNVAATDRSLSWTVPSTITNNALIRVSRNASAYTDQCDFNFTVLGMPVLTTSIPCEGFAQLDWPAITGATSYDILQLKGDTITVIANTTGLSYLVSGLNSNTTYWFGVAVKNGVMSGRRSVSKSALPTTGTCSLSNFDNNFKAVSITAPITGRQFTTGALSNAELVRFTIKNLDNISSSGSFDLYYQVNNDPAVMETSAAILTSLGSLQYSFVQTANLSAAGIYQIKAWVKKTGDIQVLDDTVSITIKNIPNPPVTLPVLEGFETALAKDYIVNTIGLDGIDRVDFKTNTERGRARTFVNTGFAYTGNRAVTLDQFSYNVALSTDSMLLTYNAATYNTGNQLRFDFYYKNHGQANNPNNKVWIRGSDNQPWILAYDLVTNQASLGNWKKALINVNDVMDPVLPAQPITTSFQIKFGQQGNTSANVAIPELDQDDGYTFDNVLLTEALNDLAITNVVSPNLSGCNMSGIQPVTINIKNYSATNFSNVPVSYSINGGAPVTEIIPSIVGNATQVFTFFTTATLTLNTEYSFDFWISAPSDNYRSNDSILNYSFRSSAVIATYPYLEGFETNDGGWYQKGINSSWQWGVPANTVINKAANGTNAWVTSLSGNYANNEFSYLYSPCFNLSGLTQPVLSFSHIFSIEDNCACDYTWVEYSADGGITWNKLGTNGTGVNWYNDPTALHQWRTSINKWHVASINLPTTSASVRFRFVMASDAGYTTEGVGIDDIHVFDKAAVYTGSQLLNTTQTVSGSNWVHFNSGSTRIASLNANGQNLGNTTVDVYPFAGAVRNQGSQYYLNRNIVVRPAIQPVTNVSVRFYFTDAEAKSLIAATGCGVCTKPNDPYELGVTKFSGTVANENGTLSDNLPWANYFYIISSLTDIIPYDNGYYAEFMVNSFSEFWLNNGGLSGLQALPLNLISFDAIKQINKVLLNWKTENEINTARFAVEKSTDGINYNLLGELDAKNIGGTNHYQLDDFNPIAGLNFYRLRMIDKDGQFKYSAIRRINFSSTEDDISLYPNPVTNSKLFIASTGNIINATLFDATGKQVKVFLLSGRNNTLELDGIVKGIYQLKIKTEFGIQTKKIIIQ